MKGSVKAQERRVYYAVKLDYDDYEIGSPGPFFDNEEAAREYMRTHGYYTTIHSQVLYHTVKEFNKWLKG